MCTCLSGDLERYGDCFVILVVRLLSAYKEELGSSLTRIRKLVDKLPLDDGLVVAPVLEEESPKAMFPRKFFEEEYLNLEAQVTVHFLTSMSKELVSLPMFQLHVWYHTCFA
ncbi:hypothetical protein CISIN_1g047303mg [Citrus sinensis]|uniref:Uncharacterized protein n=1 Tax=Citrus sinensis TaxID=2711 RepID=A0A067E3P5_CITSI|nr:hypothetical protein CISIN_1g047303mg [Citrus sinensis]